MDAAQRIVDDLLSLEINIILKPGMTARKMPEPPHALLDIIGAYDTYLCQAGNRLNPVWEANGMPPVQVRPSRETVAPQSPNRQTDPSTGRLTERLRTASVPDLISEDVFDDLRERAVEAEAVYRRLVVEQWLVDDEMGVILTRIYRNCDQVKAMLSRPELQSVLAEGVNRDSAGALGLPLESYEIVAVRKIWEIGTESVVMQTIAQLDGDIVPGSSVAARRLLTSLSTNCTGKPSLLHWSTGSFSLRPSPRSCRRCFVVFFGPARWLNAWSLLRAAWQRSRAPAAAPFRARRARLRHPGDLVTLVRGIQRLKTELLVGGGATIDTPVTPTGADDAFQIAARTVVQPDGDLLFFVSDEYFLDPDVRQLHSARVSGWFAGLENIVTASVVALRGMALILVIVTAFLAGGQAVRQGVMSGAAALAVGFGASFLLQGALRLALGSGIRRG